MAAGGGARLLMHPAALIAARHGAVGPSWAGRCYGSLDAKSIVGVQRAARAILDQVDGRVCGVHSSPLSRCAGPAGVIAEHLAAPLRIDPRLEELDHGGFEGRLWDAIHRESPGDLSAWGRSWIEEGPPGGESALQLEARVRAWLRDLPDAAPGGGVPLLVAHAGVLRALSVIVDSIGWDEAMGRRFDHLTLVQFGEPFQGPIGGA